MRVFALEPTRQQPVSSKPTRDALRRDALRRDALRRVAPGLRTPPARMYNGDPRVPPRVEARPPLVEHADRGVNAFLWALRDRALQLHFPDVRDVVPKPSALGYLRFLEESRVVFRTLEALAPAHGLGGTGLERAAALDADIAELRAALYETTGGACVGGGGGGDGDDIQPDSPGAAYSHELCRLSKADPPGFACHWYNYTFSTAAGGGIVGEAVSRAVLGGWRGTFHSWDDLPGALAAGRAALGGLVATWTPEQRKACLDQTEHAFRRALGIVRVISQ